MEILSANRKGSWILVSNILSNVASIRQRVAAAAMRADRDPSAVTIVAVSKTRTVEEIQAVLATGLTHLGENKVQEMADKYPAIGGSAIWHLIGSLQTNKVKPAVRMAHLVHSLDRDSRAQALAKEAERQGVLCRALVQVNVSGEATKHGVSPEELPAFLQRISQAGHIQVEGLMTMAPESSDPETARPHFRRLRELADQIRQTETPRVSMQHL
ncbi:MAG: YggS family pyridoxal phosphate-dependent enzyme, partial [Mycobacterium leprae]